MARHLRIDSVRARLTLFWVAVLGAALVVIGGLVYVLLARALYSRIDDNLKVVVQIATTSLANDLAEGQDYEDAARSTAAELSSREQMLAIYGSNRRLLAEGGRDDDIEITPARLTRLDGFEHRRRHGEDARIAPRYDGHRAPLRRKAQRFSGPLHLDTIVGRMPDLMSRTLRYAVEVRPVADKVRRVRQHARNRRRHVPRIARPDADDCKPATHICLPRPGTSTMAK